MHHVQAQKTPKGYIAYYHIGKSIRHVRDKEGIKVFETREKAFAAASGLLCYDLDQAEKQTQKTAIAHVFKNFKGDEK